MSGSYTQQSLRTRLLRSSRLTLCWCALVCLLGSAVLIGCTPSHSGVNSSATPSQGAQLSRAWTAVLNQIGPNGEVSLQTALQAYTLVFGPLPGGPPPENPGGVIPSGTLAVDMILSHLDELTAAQQQAVLQRLGYKVPTSAQAAQPDGAPLSTRGQSRANSLTSLVAPAGPTPVPTDAPGTAPYREMLDEFIPKLNSLLKVTLTLPIVLDFDVKATDKADTRAYDALGQSKGVPVLCRISISPSMSTAQLDNQRLVVAHELTHCYQDQIQGPLSIHYASPAWLIEGSATWTGAIVSGATPDTTWLQKKWATWLLHPEKDLFSRAYEAIGFYSLLDQAGISPWSVLPAMYLSQTKGKVPDNLAAYQAATESAPQEVLDEWASSYERDATLGLDWDLTGPGIAAAKAYGAPAIHNITLGNGQSLPITTPAYTALDDDVTSQADVVHVSISGTSRLHDSASFERVTSADGNYCTKQGGCDCPEGSANQGQNLPQLTGLVHLAVTGGEQGANGVLSGFSLQQFCNKQKPTAVPQITAAFCQSFMTVAQANAIMQPSTPASTIRIDTSPIGGSCNYEYASFKSVVSVNFLPYRGGSLSALASQLTATTGAKVTTTPVGGVGDQALFVAATLTSVSLRQDYLDVVDGAIVLQCFNPNVGSASDASQQAALTQVCQRVVNVLDP